MISSQNTALDSKRIAVIDFTRGFVMIIMALDHVRDLMHSQAGIQDPTNLASTTPVMFFTRWITHPCAPTFVFLAGLSAFYSGKTRNTSSMRRLLITRGLWLIVVEFTLVNFGIFGDVHFRLLMFEVIATIGCGFILLALLFKIPYKFLVVIALLILFLHDAFAFIPFAKPSIVAAVFSPFFLRGAIPLSSSFTFVMGYPPLPWAGIMLLGFASGRIFELPGARRDVILKRLALAVIASFVLIRAINIYGDPQPWMHQKNTIYTILSFINVTKYPPSLQFCLLMLGISLLLLSRSGWAARAWGKQIAVYGKTPLFYFVVHFYLIHTLLIILLFLQGFLWKDLDFSSGQFGRPKGVPSGVGLGAIYCIWIAVVLIMYRPCKWFGKYKARHRYWWLKYV